MSDPVTNIEIEDVLSSIRRLMSDGDWPKPDAVAKPRMNGKLVLAPSLRVDTPSEPPLVLRGPLPRAGEEGGPDEDDAKSARSRLESTIAELEAAIVDDHGEWEPDGSEATPVVDWTRATANGAIFGSRASVTRMRDIVEDAEICPPEIDEADDGGLAEDLDRSGAGDFAAANDDSPGSQDDTHVLDEDALRDLVVEIVRQELQGTLGERITRNVRKLVRREIHRVIASEDFD